MQQSGSIKDFRRKKGAKFSDIRPNGQLLYLVFYEYQHLAGRKSISKDMAYHYFEQAVLEFGSIEDAVVGVAERTGFDPLRWHFAPETN